jgi:hypothetical protein
MIVHEKTGGRTIHLYIPFEFMGKRVESITLSPMKFGHTLLWNEGHYTTMLELLIDFAGVEEGVLRELREPDASRVMEAFMLLISPQIRDDITAGVIPQKPGAPRAVQRPPQQQPQDTTNGSGGYPMMGPGDPLPLDNQPGFDMSEEP